MSEKVKQVLLIMLFNVVKVIRLLRRPKTGTIFLAPDIPISNLGDQALLLGALEGLCSQGCKPIYVVANGPELINSIPRIEAFSERITIIQDWNVMFATDRAFVESVSFYWLARKVKSIVLVGADVLDGRYNPEEAGRKLAILKKCAGLGLYTKVVGFSLSENISNSSAQGFKNLNGLADFISRDPVSQTRMQAFSPCKLGADCAFLMKPNSMEQIENQKLISWLNGPSFRVALCLRDEDFMTEETAPLLPEFAAGLVVALQKHNAKLLMIPHHPIDIEMLKLVANELNTLNFKDYFLVDSLPSSQNIKALVSQCSHIITSRMHVAIASLGMERAITCLPYAGKFEGLYQHFELEGAGLDRARAGDSEYVADFLSQRFEASDAISKHVAAALPKVKALSQSNFDGL